MKLGDIIIRFILFIYAILIIVPMVWVLYTSFKTSKEIIQDPWGLPKTLMLENYVGAWNTAKIGSYFINSILVITGMVLLTLLLSSMAAYVISRIQFKGSSFLAAFFMAGLLVPNVLGTIPIFGLLKSIKLLDTHIGLIFVYTAFALPFSIFVLYGFFKTLPNELEEAAMIDGASYFRTFFSVMLPLAKPGWITISIFNFLWYWNEYPLALTVLQSDSKRTLPLGIVHLSEIQRYAIEWGHLFAGIVIVTIPAVIVYIIFQKRLVSGLNTGALKE